MKPLAPLGRPNCRLMMTEKQVKILKAVIKGNPDGTPLDLKQLIEAVDPGQPRAQMKYSVRHLVGHGLIDASQSEVRRNREMRVFIATDKARNLMRPTDLP